MIEMRVLSDCVGHTDLYYSIYSLFEKRLGAELYCPIGTDGWESCVELFSVPVNECDGSEFKDGVQHYYRKMEPSTGYYTQKGIIFKKFLELDFDVIVATSKVNEERFYNIIKKHKPNAKFIRQINNIVESPTHSKNVLWGMNTPVPPGINYIRYHPEHYEGYCLTTPPNYNVVSSFMDDLPCYPTLDIFQLWNTLKNKLPDHTFKMYGRSGHDSNQAHPLVPRLMRDSAFIWHVKPHGGGGFIPRQALSCGKPTIIRKRYAKQFNELTVNLWEDGVNSIDLDLHTIDDAARIIREWSEPERYKQISKSIADKAKKDMNFEKEAQAISAWIASIPGGV